MREVKAVRKGGEPDIEERTIHDSHDCLSGRGIVNVQEATMWRSHQCSIFLIVWNAIDGLRPVVGGFLIIDKMVGGVSGKHGGDSLSRCLTQDFVQDALLQRGGQFG